MKKEDLQNLQNEILKIYNDSKKNQFNSEELKNLLQKYKKTNINL